MPKPSAKQQSQLLFVLVVIFTAAFTLAACAPDRNRKDRLKNVRAGTTKKADRNFNDGKETTGDANNTDAIQDPRDKGADGKGAGAGKTDGKEAPKSAPTDATPDDNKTADDKQKNDATPEVAKCKLTEAAIEGLADITEEEKKLPLCSSIDVETDEKGDIKIVERLGGDAHLAPYKITNGAFAVDKDNLVKASLPWARTTGTNAAKAFDQLIFAYELPHSAEEIDFKKDFIVGLYQTTNGVAAKEKMQDVILGRKIENGRVLIQVTNPEKIKNINFIFAVEYHLKAATP